MLKRISLLAVAILLTQLVGCATTSHHGYHYANDAAPPFPIDVSKIPDAVPKVEPMSKYGNPKSYVAEGHRYYPVKSSAGYDEKGIASWYGMKFHDVRTSSGEMYSVEGMTAAHKTLPLPTYCQVTNLQNGKQVVVKVNDRGPFKDNRIIDLSYVAAKKLGVTAHGTALVEVKAIDPRHWSGSSSNSEATEAAAVATPVPHVHEVQGATETSVGVDSAAAQTTAASDADVKETNDSIAISKSPQIFLQMGAFAVQDNADNLAAKVRKETDLPVIVKQGMSHDKPIYRVQIGPIPDVDHTDELTNKLSSAGLGKPIVAVT